MNRIRVALVNALLITITAVALGTANPAGASGTFEVNGLYECSMNGGNTFVCYYDWTGATGPYTSSTSTNTPTWVHVTEVDIFDNYAYVFGTCLKGHDYRLTLTLQDSTGAVGSGTDYGYCGG